CAALKSTYSPEKSKGKGDHSVNQIELTFLENPRHLGGELQLKQRQSAKGLRDKNRLFVDEEAEGARAIFEIEQSAAAPSLMRISWTCRSEPRTLHIHTDGRSRRLLPKGTSSCRKRTTPRREKIPWGAAPRHRRPGAFETGAGTADPGSFLRQPCGWYPRTLLRAHSRSGQAVWDRGPGLLSGPGALQRYA